MNDRPGEPLAPPRVATTGVLSVADALVFVALSVAGLWAIGMASAAWFADGLGSHPILRIILAGIVLALLVNQQGRWFMLMPMRRPVPIPTAEGLRVAVVTTFVPGAESVEMIEATLRAMVALDYPHDTWVLDEGDDPAVRELCRRHGAQHFTRRSRSGFQEADGPFRSATKHGNYNAWLHEGGFRAYDILVAFDPDHMPIPSYLSEVLGYFRDPTVGYVQVAQAYYNQAASIVAGGAAEETYAYFSAVQMAGFGLGYPIIVGGHNAHRMAALEAMGGFASHDADDLLLTLQYRAAGWQGVYVPAILARGLTPVDWRGYLVQQRRWARSVLDLKLRHNRSYARRLPLRSRLMSLLHGLNFLHRSIAYAVLIALLLWLLVTGETVTLLTDRMSWPLVALGAAMAAQELFRQRFYLDWRRESGLHWRAGLLGFAKWPWFLLALVDVVARRRVGYVVTRKTPQEEVFRPFVAWNAGLAAALVAAWAIGTRGGRGSSTVAALGAIVAAVALLLALHGLRRPPPPYRADLWDPAGGSTPLGVATLETEG